VTHAKLECEIPAKERRAEMPFGAAAMYRLAPEMWPKQDFSQSRQRIADNAGAFAHQ
jgi:hypothetical protein